MNEELAVAAKLVAFAVLHDDPASRIAAARLLDFEPMHPLTFTYRVAELVLRAAQPDFMSDPLPMNGDTPHAN
jgi:hypothetical protein